MPTLNVLVRNGLFSWHVVIAAFFLKPRLLHKELLSCLSRVRWRATLYAEPTTGESGDVAIDVQLSVVVSSGLSSLTTSLALMSPNCCCCKVLLFIWSLLILNMCPNRIKFHWQNMNSSWVIPHVDPHLDRQRFLDLVGGRYFFFYLLRLFLSSSNRLKYVWFKGLNWLCSLFQFLSTSTGFFLSIF